MKKLGILISLVLLSLILCACGRTDSLKQTMVAWQKQAGLQEEDSPKQLYDKALNEDVLTIYTVSSRLFDVAKSFEEQYPGLKVNLVYYRVEELVEKIEENAAAKTYDCDVIFCTNGDGSLTDNLIPKRLAYKYIPADMKDKMRSQGNDAYVSVLLELSSLAYNDKIYDSAPVTNWWELTDEKWKDRVYITDPSKSMISYTLFSMMDKYNDEMKEAYSEYYGSELTPVNGESAAKTYIRMLMENGLMVVNDSDDVAAAVAESDAESPVLGVMNASKMRMRDQGYSLKACYQMTPFTGVINPADIMIAGGSKNINTAKLFIRWILGEKEGTGKGYQPFLQEGAWPSRIDVEGKTDTLLEDIPAVYTDESYSAENREDFLQFWENCLSEYKKK